MPTENELKIVLSNVDSLIDKISEAAEHALVIRQGYMHRKSKLTVRVREQTELADNAVASYFLQTKLKLNKSVDFAKFLEIGNIQRTSPGRVIEISKEIDKRDFLDFWEKSKGRLSKCRYILYAGTSDGHKDHHGNPWKEIWEVDFIKNTATDQTYMVIAECELPENVQEPLFPIPDIIKDHTVFRVPLRDSRFSNSRLGNIKYARRLYKSLF